jgi:hypothetical protein
MPAARFGTTDWHLPTPIPRPKNLYISTFINVGDTTKFTSFRGACFDTGAPRSVVGLPQVKQYCLANGTKLILTPSNRRFRFADCVQNSLGTTQIHLPIPGHSTTLSFTVDVVNSDIPLLVGLDVMAENEIIPNPVRRSIDHSNSDPGKSWSIPVDMSDGHMYVKFDPATYFTEDELRRVHRHFRHPSPGKLYAILKRADPSTDSKTMQILEDISRSCDPCQRIAPRPIRFKVSGGEKTVFNATVAIDLLYLDGAPVLHIVDLSTNFSAAQFLPDVSTNTVWSCLLRHWCYIYTGLPDTIRCDQGSQFTSREFSTFCQNIGVQLEYTGIEAHNSLGAGEKYHDTLRTIYARVMCECPQLNKYVALAGAVKAMNDCSGPDGNVPSLLVFGAIPRLPHLVNFPQRRETLDDRARAAIIARKQMEEIVSRQKIARALRSKVPTSCDTTYEVGDEVLIFREHTQGKGGEWKGPFLITEVSSDSPNVKVQDMTDGPPRTFSTSIIKRYHRLPNIQNVMFNIIRDGLWQFINSADHYYAQDELVPVQLTEILTPDDPRASDEKMTEAKQKEIGGLIARNTFRAVLREDVPTGANKLKARYVLAIKDADTNKCIYKARYVLGGHRDRLKHLLVHTSSTLRPPSIRIILAVSAILEFKVWTVDISQAYLQSANDIDRDIFVDNPAPEFALSPDQCLQLIRPLYGLGDANEMWYLTLHTHHTDELGMKALRSDPALYSRFIEGILQGMSGTYVDDLCRAGTTDFEKHVAHTSERFDAKPPQDLPATFTGFEATGNTQIGYQLSQVRYIQTLVLLDVEAKDFSAFASLRMKLAWIAYTRPDIAFAVSQNSQVTITRYKENSKELTLSINKIVKHLLESASLTLKYPKMHRSSLHLKAFSDASFGNNVDSSSQLGYIIFLCDGKGACAPLVFKSYKCRRVTRSVFASELLAFADMIDQAITLRVELSTLLSQDIPLQALTDSKSLFDVMTKRSATSERRLMLDIACAQDAWTKQDISDIGFIRSAENIADGLTKQMKQASLLKVLETSQLDVKVEQWIVRR